MPRCGAKRVLELEVSTIRELFATYFRSEIEVQHSFLFGLFHVSHAVGMLGFVQSLPRRERSAHWANDHEQRLHLFDMLHRFRAFAFVVDVPWHAIIWIVAREIHC